EATAFELPVLVSASDYFKSSLIGGLIGGLLFLAYTVLLNVPKDPSMSLRVMASLVAGEAAVSGNTSIATVALGLLSLIALSLFWSVVFGLLLAGSRTEWTPSSIVTIGMVFGSVMWL